MASFIDAVAKRALKRLLLVAELCLAKIASTMARFASVSPGLS